MSGRVLHLLSQQPSRTGSGITLEAIVRLAQQAGWTQAAVVGIPVSASFPQVGDLPTAAIYPVTFADNASGDIPGDLPFPVVGMSDVMPYSSSVWSTLDAAQLDQYRQVWQSHLTRVINEFQPDIIHSNHVWLMSSLLRNLAPDLPLVATCHATGLRQLTLCPGLAYEVIEGCRGINHFCALRQDHRTQLAEILDIPRDLISVVGVGFRDDIFFPDPDRDPEPGSLLYVGKFSRSKGLPWLLDAVEDLSRQGRPVVLHVAGDGAGDEAEALRERMKIMSPIVIMHGQLDQHQLANLMRRCQVCALPSFYEGVPLVLAEAAACGCRIVATDLPGVKEQLAPHLGGFLHTVAMPPLDGIDTPAVEGLSPFVADLARNLTNALDRGPSLGDRALVSHHLEPLAWGSVFQRVENIWKMFINKG